MVRTTESSGGSIGELRVNLPDLRGYALLLDDSSRDLGSVQWRADSYCQDADFGKILEELTDDYAALLPQLHELLAENEQVMRSYAVELDRLVIDYERTDDTVADTFGGRGINGGSGINTWAFAPVSHIDSSESPSPSEGELPEVSFGFVFDKLAWALEKFCGWDVRAEVTDWIAGDVVGLSTQADAWEINGRHLNSVRDNLAHGISQVSNTWSGQANNVHAGGMIVWDLALESQSTALTDLAEHLRSLAKDAVDTAQLVVDCIRLAVDLISSAWALQYIPIYGQARFVKKAWDAYKTASKATAYLRMLISAIRAVKSFIVVCVNELTPSMLPGRPISL